MKKKIIITLVLLVGILLPLNMASAAKKYNTLNFRETLAEEGIEEKFTDYEEKDDQITIYLFRGKGCGYCRAFLEFMNSITNDYGKYFKLQSYEVWNDEANATLMGEVSEYLNEPAGGVPYIIIGDKVFAGYASDYDEGIKQAIVELYNTKKSKRYDVFKQMKKASNSLFSETTLGIVIWPLIFTFIGTVVVMSYVNIKFKELSLKLEDLKNTKPVVEKEERKPVTNKKVTTKEKKK